MTALPAFADDVVALFAARGAGRVEVPILQPADPFLDMAGEDLRRRIFLTESETGDTLCLRPEFTIPVCLDHIDKRAATPRRYSYLGDVFRQRRDGPAQFLQAGIEDLGESDIATADARSIADAAALVGALLPGRPLAITIGDQSVFEAVLAALGLPRGWQKRLTRAFGSAETLAAALADLANPSKGGALDEATAALVMDGEAEPLAAHVAGLMEQAGLSPTAGRTPQEVARRLIDKSVLRSVRLSDEALEALKRFLAIRAPLGDAANVLDGFARDAGLSINAALARFAERGEKLAADGLDMGALTYDAGFGRPLDYYTGLVFEVSAPNAARPLAGGGRYDRLLTLLGAPHPIPGVGFSVWLDRIAELRGAA